MKTKSKRVVVIDSVNQTVTESQVTSLQDCQKIVGGLIERVTIFENGDELYVNEEGRLTDPKHWFMLKQYAYPLAGNAYIIGKVTRGGNNMDAKTSVEEIQSGIWFESFT